MCVYAHVYMCVCAHVLMAAFVAAWNKHIIVCVCACVFVPSPMLLIISTKLHVWMCMNEPDMYTHIITTCACMHIYIYIYTHMYICMYVLPADGDEVIVIGWEMKDSPTITERIVVTTKKDRQTDRYTDRQTNG
jgi:hypothetical protein